MKMERKKTPEKRRKTLEERRNIIKQAFHEAHVKRTGNEFAPYSAHQIQMLRFFQGLPPSKEIRLNGKENNPLSKSATESATESDMESDTESDTELDTESDTELYTESDTELDTDEENNSPSPILSGKVAFPITQYSKQEAAISQEEAEKYAIENEEELEDASTIEQEDGECLDILDEFGL